ncbi:MAG: ABC transporter ATP-binding protein, partial [Oscillospiraceae bacterium]|nr:ABC transporter ATP-binding protein [Candidatus Equicaccousia limihippi]
YKPYKGLFVADMLASLFISAIGIVYPMVTNTMLNEFIEKKFSDKIIFFGILIFVLYFIRMGLRYFVQYYGHMIGTGMQAQMRRDLFGHLQKLPYTYFDHTETGTIISRITNDLFEVAELAHHGPENLIVCSLTVIGSFIYLCTINVPLTLIIFCCVPVLLFVSAYFRRKMREAFKERRATTAAINATTESSITGIRVTKAFCGEKTEFEKFEKNNQKFVEACKKSYKAMGLFHSISSFITDVFNVIIIIAGGLFLCKGDITVGNYAAFIVSVNVFINPVTTLIGFMEQYQNGVSGFSRFLEILDLEPEKENDGAQPLETVVGDIEFKNVCFGYGDEKGDVLKNISLKIKPGQKLALVGHSGGGKTTLCHLIPNFYHVERGEVLVDGRNVNDITFESLRQNIGIVQQDVFLFDGTIKENILYGDPNATDEMVIEAAKRANIHEFVEKLDHGYDTNIGERGVRLSGGQKQRISIARAFLKDPAMLILDEATSALDNTTEIAIQKSLDELCSGRTTIIVAHRLSTVKNADEIAVIEDGTVLEKGTHQQLIDKDGVYKKLYELQFREDEKPKHVHGIAQLI